MPQTVTIQLTESDYLAANKLHYRRKPEVLLGWFLIGIAGYLLVNAPDQLISLTGVALLAVAAARLFSPLFIRTLVLPWRTRKIFRQSKQLQESHEVSWDSDRLFATAANWSATVLWTDFIKHRENEEMLLLYPNDLSFRMFPKRFFDEPTFADFAIAMRAKVRKD